MSGDGDWANFVGEIRLVSGSSASCAQLVRSALVLAASFCQGLLDAGFDLAFSLATNCRQL
jgi:hypothetical protein